MKLTFKKACQVLGLPPGDIYPEQTTIMLAEAQLKKQRAAKRQHPRPIRVQVPVALLEFDDGGSTIWVHGPNGATVLRLKAKKIVAEYGCQNICAHTDIMIDETVTVCMPEGKSCPSGNKSRSRTRKGTGSSN